ncbi:peptide chain release factor N(5)-glutamine methyltransferase [Mycoplasmopsis felifaucium]|uniref:peptide chain release factor N(5)-glutamine methyltransferase n=1 Tax=Mycoplasmopsis felifaucium TaxID=35768 RepID=A0ABZ2RPZ8_9BACT
MPTKEDLILEKRRYGLPEIVSEEEQEMLNNNWPVQYIMGYIEYANVHINLNHKVLIPRYETEELIYLIVQNYLKTGMKVLDLCCGSGFIGIGLKKNFPDIQLTMSDIDPEAIEQTKENVLINFKDNKDIKILHSDLFDRVFEKFDLIVSNPPYVSFNDIDASSDSLKHEPQHAIYAPENGWYFYEKILNEAPKYLNENGLLIFEINPKHIEKWRQINNCFIFKDICGKDRFAVIKI